MTANFNDSEEGQLFLLIKNKHLEKRKQNALYQDDEWVTSVEDDFAEQHVNSIFKIADDREALLI
jgi:hypothetical protein